jgi:hypothetical protein
MDHVNLGRTGLKASLRRLHPEIPIGEKIRALDGLGRAGSRTSPGYEAAFGPHPPRW